MAKFKTEQVSMAGVCCILPKNRMSVEELGTPYFSDDIIKKTTASVGVKQLFFADYNQTASDLCFEAAENLMAKLAWEKDSIDGLVFVSQTPDYVTPATSCILQDKLGLSKDCMTLDVNLGCSGFAYGYFLASNLIESGACKRVLLLVGDTLTKDISKEDKGLTFIIGDGASATALEKIEYKNPTSLIVKSDGSGYESLIIPAGGSRIPCSEETKIPETDDEGNRRSQEDLFMDGMGVFTFAVKEVPKMINELIDYQGVSKDDIDLFLLHQANAYMLKYIGKRSKIPPDKIPINIDEYGNTSGSTIPFLLCDMNNENRLEGKTIIMCGFGIGLSWGGICTKVDKLKCSEIIRQR